MGRTEEAKKTKARLQIENLEAALKLYKLDNGAYPTTEQGLEALTLKPSAGVIPKSWREGGTWRKRRSRKTLGDGLMYTSPPVSKTRTST